MIFESPLVKLPDTNNFISFQNFEYLNILREISQADSCAIDSIVITIENRASNLLIVQVQL